jgi:hypothetical protein
VAPQLLSLAWIVVFGVAATPAGASAVAPSAHSLEASGSAAQRLPYPVGFTVKASNGYSAFVLGVPARKGHPSAIAIFVTGKNNGAFYSAPANVTEKSIQAPLGALGEIAVTFHPSGQARSAHSECGGKPVSFDSGYYEGTIDFHGEQGYTDVEATKARGGFGFLLDIVCPGISGSSGGPSVPGAELDIGRPSSQLGPHLRVVKNRPSARAHYEVGVSEMSNGVSIERFASLVTPASTFNYDPKVQTATLHPPAPFSGSAQFHRGPTLRNRWTGDLTVDLPGRTGVMLTGDGLQAKLSHAHWDWNHGSQ